MFKSFWTSPKWRYTKGARSFHDCIALRSFPTGRRLTPVIFSSPHSGRDYPAGLLRATALDEMAIRSSEDAFVDELFRQHRSTARP